MSYAEQQAEIAVRHYESQELCAANAEIEIEFQIALEKTKLLTDAHRWCMWNVDDPTYDMSVILKLAECNREDPAIIGEAVLRILDNRLRDAAENAI